MPPFWVSNGILGKAASFTTGRISLERTGMCKTNKHIYQLGINQVNILSYLALKRVIGKGRRKKATSHESLQKRTIVTNPQSLAAFNLWGLLWIQVGQT